MELRSYLRTLFDGDGDWLLKRCLANGISLQRFLCEVLTGEEFAKLVRGRGSELQANSPRIRKRLSAAIDRGH